MSSATSGQNKSKGPFVVDGRFSLVKRIGEGSFGKIYEATNLQNGQEVAVKMEKVKVRKGYAQLKHEYDAYTAIGQRFGFAKIYWFGKEREFNAMVMEMLGPSVEDLKEFVKKHNSADSFSLKTVLMLADQMIGRLESLHNQGFIHRDLKPENFLFGKTGKTMKVVYLTDLGLAKRYIKGPNNQHISSSQPDRTLIGTARYASIQNHRGYALSRRDDLQSLGYLLIYLLKGKLPWQGLARLPKMSKEDRYNLIGELKTDTTSGQLCQGIPKQFADYMDYCMLLDFEEKPDYLYLRTMFRLLMKQEQIAYDFVFDWMTSKKKKSGSENSKNLDVKSDATTTLSSLSPPSSSIREIAK